MLEVAVSLVDRLIQLATVRERNREKYFNGFIEPLYRDAEQIARDYMTLFAELIHRLAKAQDTAAVIDWLEERRSTFQPVRMKVRALMEEGLEYDTKEPVDRFRKGIWGLMKGGTSLLEEGHGRTREYGFGGHTVLDIMMRLRGEAISSNRHRFIDHARGQQMAVEGAWRDVVAGYAEIKHRSLKS
jgi:hypothetical protein